MNDIRATPFHHDPRARMLAVSGLGAACKAFTRWPTPNDGPWDDVDDECFLAALLEMERNERVQAGILGRWPFWEIRTWAILNPERAETALGVGVIAAGVTLGVLWHVLSPHLARLVPPSRISHVTRTSPVTIRIAIDAVLGQRAGLPPQ